MNKVSEKTGAALTRCFWSQSQMHGAVYEVRIEISTRKKKLELARCRATNSEILLANKKIPHTGDKASLDRCG